MLFSSSFVIYSAWKLSLPSGNSPPSLQVLLVGLTSLWPCCPSCSDWLRNERVGANQSLCLSVLWSLVGKEQLSSFRKLLWTRISLEVLLAISHALYKELPEGDALAMESRRRACWKESFLMTYLNFCISPCLKSPMPLVCLVPWNKRFLYGLS